MTRVAMFTTYAPSEGFGGPARALQQRVVLEGAGHDVVHVVLQARSGRGNLRHIDHVELVERPYGAPIDHIYHDVDLGERAANDPRLIERIERHLRSAGTEVIVLEQPFLVGVVDQLAKDLDVPVVYSCQNIEYRLRRDLERFQPDPRRLPSRHEQVRELEQRAVDLSTTITTICPHDRDEMIEEFGRSSTLVPNGSTIADMSVGGENLHPHADVRFSFAGSAYWPNVEGFADIATPSLAFLPPTCRIDVAGTVGGEILRNPAILRCQSANASRIAVNGFVAAEKLAALMASSRAVLVPVFVGEGSNLKSADALASGAPVIMTRRAVRGYEDVIADDDEGIVVVDTASEFREAMAHAVQSPRAERVVGSRRRKRLTWSSRLQPLIDVIEQLGPTPSKKRGTELA